MLLWKYFTILVVTEHLQGLNSVALLLFPTKFEWRVFSSSVWTDEVPDLKHLKMNFWKVLYQFFMTPVLHELIFMKNFVEPAWIYQFHLIQT